MLVPLLSERAKQVFGTAAGTAWKSSKRPRYSTGRACSTSNACQIVCASKALHDRRPVHRGELVHHSDRGIQYVSIRYTERLAEAGVEPSVANVGDSYDNAPAETINAVSTRPRSSTGAGRGGASRPSSSRRWNGSTGSTIAGCLSPSATSRRPKPPTMPTGRNPLWRRDSNQMASGKPGAVYFEFFVEFDITARRSAAPKKNGR